MRSSSRRAGNLLLQNVGGNTTKWTGEKCRNRSSQIQEHMGHRAGTANIAAGHENGMERNGKLGTPDTHSGYKALNMLNVMKALPSANVL